MKNKALFLVLLFLPTVLVSQNNFCEKTIKYAYAKEGKILNYETLVYSVFPKKPLSSPFTKQIISVKETENYCEIIEERKRKKNSYAEELTGSSFDVTRMKIKVYSDRTEYYYFHYNDMFETYSVESKPLIIPHNLTSDSKIQGGDYKVERKSKYEENAVAYTYKGEANNHKFEGFEDVETAIGVIKCAKISWTEQLTEKRKLKPLYAIGWYSPELGLIKSKIGRKKNYTLETLVNIKDN